MRRFVWGCASLTAMLGLGLVATPATAGTVTLSNGIYEIHVETAGTGGTGSWNAVTAASHPTGAGNDLLYSGSTTTTNYSTLRVYTATAGPLDYSFGGSGGGIDLDGSFLSEGASPYGVTGQRTIWGVTSHSLRITQDVFIAGSVFSDSAIYHTVLIENTGMAGGAASIGWRNLYDWAVNDPGFDDGPNNTIESLGSGVVVPATTTEFTHTPGTDDFARVSVDPGVPSYEPLLGLGLDPLLHFLPTTAPEAYAYTSWGAAFGSAFDYTTSPINVTGDSAGLSWWGRTSGTSYEILPDGSIRFTQTIFGVEPGEPPPVIPEPSTLALFGLGLIALLGAKRRLRKVEENTAK